MKRLLSAAREPRDAAALAVFRMMFGALMLGAVVRYFQMGWIDELYVQPSFHFTYYGFDWVRPLPQPGMTIVFIALGMCAAAIALGALYRVASAAFFVLFTYVHLIDVANYLNHYYLVSVIALLMCALPLHRAWSIDAWLRPSIRAATLPAWITWLFRAQIGTVYLFAGLAKLNADWLVHGQPLAIWLRARGDTPIIGSLLEEHWAALAMSWAGFLFDTTIPLWLSWRRSRPFAYAVLCVFHFFTHVFFDIGIFPFVMTIAATVFFDPRWPRAWIAKVRRAERAPIEASPSTSRWPIALAGLWLLVQIAVPLRTHLYGGNVLWHEQGMRWSWRVMVREKNAVVSYRVRWDGEPRERVVNASECLCVHQAREFAGEPDLVLQLAHRIRDDLERRGRRGVEVRADAWASLNGRRSARLVDPDVDLARVEDGFARAAWILPSPGGPPMRVRGRGEEWAAR